MDVVRWKNEILRWDLPDRWVAGFGAIWITFLALVAGVLRAVSERFTENYDTELPSNLFANTSISAIALIYMATMMGIGVLLATAPKESKAGWCLLLLGGVSLFFFFVAIANLAWGVSGMKTVI